MYFCVQIKYFMRTDKMRVTTHRRKKEINNNDRRKLKQ